MKFPWFRLLFVLPIFYRLHHVSNALSVCRPVDTVIVLNSKLITEDNNHQKAKNFLDKLAYDASSELSGIGLVIYNEIPITLDPSLPSDPSTRSDYTFLGLNDTTLKNTKRTRKVLDDLMFNDFYDESLMSESHIVSLQDALSSAHNVFINEGEEDISKALFIFDTDSNSDSKQLCKSRVQNPKYIDHENVYYVEIDSNFEIDSVYDCAKGEDISRYDPLTDLYEITCPSLHKSSDGTVKFDKKTQLIEPWSIKACNLITNHNEERNQQQLSPESTIIVYDDLYDDMSYEVGYYLLALPSIFKLLPKECHVPVFKILEVNERERKDDNDERESELKVTNPDIFEYIMEGYISSSSANYVSMKSDAYVLNTETLQKTRRKLFTAKGYKRRLFVDCFWSPDDCTYHRVKEAAQALQTTFLNCGSNPAACVQSFAERAIHLPDITSCLDCCDAVGKCITDMSPIGKWDDEICKVNPVFCLSDYISGVCGLTDPTVNPSNYEEQHKCAEGYYRNAMTAFLATVGIDATVGGIESLEGYSTTDTDCSLTWEFEEKSFKMNCNKEDTFDTSEGSIGIGIISGTGTISTKATVDLDFTVSEVTWGSEEEPVYKMPSWPPQVPPIAIKDSYLFLKGTMKMSVKVDATASGTFEFSIPLWKKYIGTKPFVVWAGAVPIVYWPKIVLSLDGIIDSTVEFKTSYGFEYNGEFQIRMKYSNTAAGYLFDQQNFIKGTFKEDTTLFDVSGDIDQVPTCPSVIPITIKLPIKVGVEFYEMVYPFVRITPALESEITMPYDGCDYNDGGCTAEGFPTGVLFDPKLTLTVDVAIESSGKAADVLLMGASVCSPPIVLLDRLLLYDIPQIELCHPLGVLPVFLWQCCDESLMSASTSSIVLSDTHPSCDNILTLSEPGAWCAGTTDNEQSSITINLEQIYRIDGISTKGRGDGAYQQWVKSYDLYYTNDDDWNIISLDGNIDKNTAKTHQFDPPLTANTLLIKPTDENEWKSMRVEIYGQPMNLIDGLSLDAFSWTDSHDSCGTNIPTFSNSVGWCAGDNDDDNTYLQVNLGNIYSIQAIATKGRGDYNQYVTSYNLLYSTDGIKFIDYNPSGSCVDSTVLTGNTDSNTENIEWIPWPYITAKYLRFTPTKQYIGHKSMRIEAYGLVETQDALIEYLQSESFSWSDSDPTCTNDPRFSSSDGWCAGNNSDPTTYLQIDLRNIFSVSRVSTKWRGNQVEWVWSYDLQHSIDGISFINYVNNPLNNNRWGNQNTEFKQALNPIITARYLRFIPLTFSGHKSMRIEAYGSYGGGSQILNHLMPDSFSWSDRHDSCSNTPTFDAGAWCSATDEPSYLDIKLGNTYCIGAFATKGRGDNEYNSQQWVDEYELYYSTDDGISFRLRSYSNQRTKLWDLFETGILQLEELEHEMDLIEEENKGLNHDELLGNTDQYTAVTHYFNPPIIANALRIFPLSYHEWQSMRVEAYRYYSIRSLITDAGSTATFTPTDQEDSCSNTPRFDDPSAWCAELYDNSYSYLEIDLGHVYLIDSVSTKGRGDWPQWVTEYHLRYSFDGDEYSYYSDDSGAIMFSGNTDSNTPVNHQLKPMYAQYLRFIPADWFEWRSMRVDVYGSVVDEVPAAAKVVPVDGEYLNIKQKQDKYYQINTTKSTLALFGLIFVLMVSFNIAIVYINCKRNNKSRYSPVSYIDSDSEVAV